MSPGQLAPSAIRTKGQIVFALPGLPQFSAPLSNGTSGVLMVTLPWLVPFAPSVIAFDFVFDLVVVVVQIGLVRIQF